MDEQIDAREQVLSRFREIVEAGFAQWWINEDGQTEFHLNSGEVYLLGETHLTRTR